MRPIAYGLIIFFGSGVLWFLFSIVEIFMYERLMFSFKYFVIASSAPSLDVKILNGTALATGIMFVRAANIEIIIVITNEVGKNGKDRFWRLVRTAN